MKIAVLGNLRTMVPEGVVFPLGDDYWNDLDKPETIGAIVEALRSLGHQVEFILPDEKIFDNLRSFSPDFVFNYAEMYFGSSREAQVPAILDMMRIPYTGSGVVGMALTQHKAFTNQICKCAGINMPGFVLIENPEIVDTGDLTYPLFVKPAHQGSSIGINQASKVNNRSELEAQVYWLWDAYGEPVIIEEYISGRDINLGFIGGEALAFVEYIVPIGYYTLEYKEAKRPEVRRICPAEIPDDIAKEMISAGKTAIHELEVLDWCRMDFRIDEAGQYYLIEVNATSTLTENGGFTSGAYGAGYADYKDVIGGILTSAVKRYAEKP